MSEPKPTVQITTRTDLSEFVRPHGLLVARTTGDIEDANVIFDLKHSVGSQAGHAWFSRRELENCYQLGQRLQEAAVLAGYKPPASVDTAAETLLLWLHLASEHSSYMPPENATLERLRDQHRHEHNGPGGIRDHDEASRVFDAELVTDVLRDWTD